jgi:hypothetical protein
LRRAAKVDSNQSEIVAALRKRGAVCLIVSQLKNCFDILVCFNSKVFMVEIKDGNKPLSARKLTEGEQEFKSKIESVGCTYWIIESIEDALNMLQENNSK